MPQPDLTSSAAYALITTAHADLLGEYATRAEAEEAAEKVRDLGDQVEIIAITDRQEARSTARSRSTAEQKCEARLSVDRAKRTAVRVRVRDTVDSTLRGQVLNVVRTESKRRMGARTTSYLCEMPGYKYPGWFREEEVDRVES